MNAYYKLGLSIVTATCLLATTAHAGSHSYASDAVLFGKSDPFQNLGLNAGFNLTIPLGASSSNHQDKKARMGLKLSLDQSDYYASSPQNLTLSGDLLELGFNFDGSPNLQMYGQDIYTPLFGPLYADDTEKSDDQPKPKGDNTAAILIGIAGIGTLGTLVLVNEAADDFSDCFRDIFRNDDPKCN